MSIQSRRVFLVVLTGIFLCQTWLVYVDAAGRELPALSAQASRGQELWHQHNCQACHQLYGFGGFLGPDLTNLAQRLEGPPGETGPDRTALARRLETVLTTGSERMPAFNLDAQEREAMATFLEELGRTGTGQIQVSESSTPRELFDALVGRAESLGSPMSDEARRGSEIAAERGCIDCHLPNGKSAFRATDLTRIHTTIDADRLSLVLTQGIPQKGMPSFGLGPGDVEAVAAFLEHLAGRGAEFRESFEASERGSGGSLLDLPWFEYPR